MNILLHIKNEQYVDNICSVRQTAFNNVCMSKKVVQKNTCWNNNILNKLFYNLTIYIIFIKK